MTTGNSVTLNYQEGDCSTTTTTDISTTTTLDTIKVYEYEMVISSIQKQTQGTISIKLEVGTAGAEEFQITTESSIIRSGDVLTGTIKTKHNLGALSWSPYVEFVKKTEFCLFNCNSDYLIFDKIKFTTANNSM